MRLFDYTHLPNELLTSEIMNLVSSIHEYRGKQEQVILAKPGILDAMLEIAKIQSTGASNRIEGIFTLDERLEALVKHKIEPQSRSEREIAGYREVLALIHENHEFMIPRPNLILQIHRDLYRFSPSYTGGIYKNADNQIEETDALGNRIIRFQPLSAFETPDAMNRLTAALLESVHNEQVDPLLLLSMFTLDFLCIHPFNDGNGRMSRLLTLLLLYRAGYAVGRYVSIEAIIEKTKETYYETLLASSVGWHEAQNNYLPFVQYYLGIVLNACREFSSQVEHLQQPFLSKPERIRRMFGNTLNRLSKKDIHEHCPDISISTIEIALSAMVKEGYIVKIGAGKSTTYIRNTNQP